MTEEGKEKTRKKKEIWVGESLIKLEKEKLEILRTVVEILKTNQEILISLKKGSTITQGNNKTTLELSLAKLAELPWRDYKRGNGSWIFANTEGAEKLRSLIQESANGKVPIGDYEYGISKGDTAEFISRNPLKK